MIEVIDSFYTMNPPEPKMDLFDGKELTKLEKLNEELQDQAAIIVQTCKTKLHCAGEDIDLNELKDITKIALDVQKAFFSDKNNAVTINNIQQNISNTQLNHFKGLLQNEI